MDLCAAACCWFVCFMGVGCNADSIRCLIFIIGYQVLDIDASIEFD